MAKRHERSGQDPYAEGSVREIYEKFFGKMIFLKPDDFTIKEWLEMLFHVSDRRVEQYRAKADFALPGLLYILVPNLKVQGRGYREVCKGDRLWARFDAQTRSIDVEFHGGPGKREQVFSVTRGEWSRLQQYLRKE